MGRRLVASHLVGRRLVASHLVGRRLVASHLVGRRLVARHLVGRRLVARHTLGCPVVRIFQTLISIQWPESAIQVKAHLDYGILYLINRRRYRFIFFSSKNCCCCCCCDDVDVVIVFARFVRSSFDNEYVCTVRPVQTEPPSDRADRSVFRDVRFSQC